MTLISLSCRGILSTITKFAGVISNKNFSVLNYFLNHFLNLFLNLPDKFEHLPGERGNPVSHDASCGGTGKKQRSGGGQSVRPPRTKEIASVAA